MGKRYDRLDLDHRIEISRLHAAAKSGREIGHMMGR
jgi:IS30 family transposase